MDFFVKTANAATIDANSGVGIIITKIINTIVIPLVALLFFSTMLIFVWGIFKLVINSNDPSAREEGQRHILWGIVGMFIMVSVYGIIRVIGHTTGAGDPFL